LAVAGRGLVIGRRRSRLLLLLALLFKRPIPLFLGFAGDYRLVRTTGRGGFLAAAVG